jgi:triacylglycerol lipase
MITNELILDIAYLCKLSYLTQEEINSIFNDNIKYGNLKRHCKDTPIYHDSNNRNDCEVYTVIYKDNLIIVFRGTESLTDVQSDLNICKNELQIKNTTKVPKVHTGFLKQLLSVDESLKKIIKDFKTKYPDGNLITCGHSLGGGIASIAALKYTSNLEIPTYCITFGSPRVGNSDFCKEFNNKILSSIRIVNDDDPIPLVPLPCTYTHVDGIKWLCDEKVLTKSQQCCKWLRFIRNFFLSCSTCCLVSAFEDHTMDNYIDDLEHIENFKNNEQLYKV